MKKLTESKLLVHGPTGRVEGKVTSDDTFDETRNAVHQALLEHSRDFQWVFFELQEVTEDGRFVYNLTGKDGRTITYKAKWYLLNGMVTIDLTGQSEVHINTEGEEILFHSVNQFEVEEEELVINEDEKLEVNEDEGEEILLHSGIKMEGDDEEIEVENEEPLLPNVTQ